MLFELSLAQNELEGPVPAWLNGLTNLQGLCLNDNELTGSIPDLRALQRARQLELQRRPVRRADGLRRTIQKTMQTLVELREWCC